jgi:hypothetical protein
MSSLMATADEYTYLLKTDKDWRVIFVEKELLSRLGKLESNVEEKHFSQLFSSNTHLINCEKISEKIQTDLIWEAEIHNPAINGTAPIKMTVTPSYDDNILDGYIFVLRGLSISSENNANKSSNISALTLWMSKLSIELKVAFTMTLTILSTLALK